jgi:hypothetical protein
MEVHEQKYSYLEGKKWGVKRWEFMWDTVIRAVLEHRDRQRARLWEAFTTRVIDSNIPILKDPKSEIYS